MSIQIRDKLYRLEPGDVVILPPGIPHKAVIHDQDQPYSRFVFWISVEYYQRLRQMSEDYYYLVQCAAEKKQYVYHNSTVEFSGIQSKIFHLIEELHAQRYGKEARIFINICDLLLHLNRMAYEKKQSGKNRRGSESLSEYSAVY
ncbi:AraC family ligand binding domain-containing protein [Blautia argi]|uniref:AraC family ligand binding domain-containing protein n=1 Tax=Blautia argi TaxID=1912897 RepID=UPI002E8E4965|nr:AraC family ligand binding domain-containing protein [Blautia argi]